MDGDGTRVLIVEDDLDTADLFGAILLGRGYSVAITNDGPTAIAELPRFAPHIALLDLGLPEISGYEIARRIRDEHPHVRLAAISGYGQALDRERSLRAGFEAHLLKPIGMAEILELVATLRTGARSENLG